MKKSACIGSITYLLFFANLVSFSQIKTYNFQHINASSGLKNEKVSDFVQDNTGFIWIATDNGLYRYDGIRCKYFNLLSEKQRLHLNAEITCMVKVKDGNFLIGTKNNGLYRFNPESGKTKYCSSSDTSLYSTTINSILAEKDSIYIGTDVGLYKLSSNYKNLKRCSNVPINRIYKIYKSSDGTIWLGTQDYGLVSFGRKNYQCHIFKPDEEYGNSIHSIISILEANDSILYLGTWDNGLLSFNRKTKRFTKIKSYDRFNTCVVKDLASDKEGNIWIATFAEGLGRYSISNKTFTFFKAQPDASNSISNNTILRIFKDNSDVLWIGTWGGYACTLDLNAPPTHSIGNNLNQEISSVSNDISCIYQELNGRLWISSYTNGLVEVSMNKKKYNTYNVPVLSNSAINTIVSTHDGRVWVGTCNGLDEISPDGKKITVINLPASKINRSANLISSLYVDASDNLWIGSDYGEVNFFDYRHHKLITYKGKKNPGFINDFYCDKNDVVWVAGSNGLFKVDREQKQIVNSDYYQNNTIPFSIRRILPLNNGNLLLGTANSGLLEYSRRNNSVIHRVNYAVLGSVYDMKTDSNAVLWITTSNGLFSYDHHSGKITGHSYQQDIQKIAYSSLFLLQNHLLAVGGKGLHLFDPYYKRKNIKPAPIVFTDLSVMDRKIEPGDSLHGRIVLNKDISVTKKIQLKYSENIFTLYFALLDYSNPKIIEYRYKLEGFDKSWRYTNANKAFATYTNLNDGTYNFEVEATNENNQWENIPAKISIDIIPPFWRSLWFRSLIMLLIFWLFYSFYRQKLAVKQKEVEKLKNEKLQAEIKNKEEILALKNAELTSSAVHISNKNEILQEIKRSLRSIKYVTDGKEINKTTNRITNLIDQNFATDNHWEQFEVHFNQLHHNFLEKLKKDYPELTQSNLKLCAYLRMNLGSKEIASLMNISPNAVLKSKYRLKLKFHLDKDQDLMDFILNY